MEPAFWTDRWRKGEVGFHQNAINDLLIKHWPSLGVPSGAAVFVPLAGKSLDMAWLAAQGHKVIGSELSELALDAFLSGQSLVPAESLAGPLVVKRAAPYELWCGDYFALPPAAFRNVAAAYDRAALIAMPPVMRQRYADKLAALLPPGAQVLLITVEYDPVQMTGPPFSVPADEVDRLFGGRFDVRSIERRDGLPRSENLKNRGLSNLAEAVYHLARTGD